ncbi:MAG TPA: hypothetical protein VGF45_18430 [Polyangia bacterium]
MIDLSRQVAEGALPGNDDQRASALSLLGIGLYLDGRSDGAERAFTELVRLRPRWSLDPRTTRPEVVAFFRDVRRRTSPPPSVALAFLPPIGQFQNDTPKRGWLIGGLELVTLASAIGTRLVLSDWRGPNGECRGGGDTKPCNNLRLANWISVGAFATTWAIGVVDALANHPSSDEQIATAPKPPKVAFTLMPSGAALQVSF